MDTHCVVYGFDNMAVAEAVVLKQDQAKLPLKEELITTQEIASNKELHNRRRVSPPWLHIKGFERWTSH